MNIEEMIKKTIKEKGYSVRQFSKEIDMPYTTLVTMLQNGIDKSSLANVSKVFRALDLPLGDFIEEIPYIEEEKEVRNIPLIGRIAAGLPILAEENIEDYFAIDSRIKADFCLRVKGNSMVDLGINNDDIVFIKRQASLENGEIGAVLIDDEATLKTFYKNDNSIILQPANKNYEPMVYTSGNIRILGKLVACLSINR